MKAPQKVFVTIFGGEPSSVTSDKAFLKEGNLVGVYERVKVGIVTGGKIVPEKPAKKGAK